MALTLAQLSKLTFEERPKRGWDGIAIRVSYARLPGRVAHLRGIGVDPGRKFGVSVISGHDVLVYQGMMPAEEEQWLYGLRAYNMMAQPTFYNGVGSAVIEGAAYKMPHGEANLAYIRFGFLLGLYYAGYDVTLAPPATIRKEALGSGKKHGLEVWPDLTPHGADSLVAALYAASLED